MHDFRMSVTMMSRLVLHLQEVGVHDLSTTMSSQDDFDHVSSLRFAVSDVGKRGAFRIR